MLIAAIIFITLALVLYTIGVWAEKVSGLLKLWHLITFWMGFICDTVGTTIMGIIARNKYVEEAASASRSFHGMVGILAIVLMLFHAIWATVVIVKRDDKLKRNFHRFSLVVWLIWLVPYISGMIMGMRG